jgi:hypothetical protein
VPGYYCQGSAELVDGRGARHMNVGGQAIDAPRSPKRSSPRWPPQRCKPAWPPHSNSNTATTPPWPSTAAKSNRPATNASKAERRYRAVDLDNRLVARGLETEWNTALQPVADAQAELTRRETTRPKP